jgi:redox-sensing transcriptional repressor
VAAGRERKIPEPTLARLRRYQLALRQLRRAREVTVSSQRLGREAGTDAALVRKDLSYFSCVGQPGVGYEIDEVLAALQEALGPPGRRPLVIIGAGPLGAALAGYAGFEMSSYELVGLFDSNPARVGHHLQGLPVRPMNELPRVVVETGVRLALIAVPAARAQEAVDQCVAAGLRGLLHFAPVHLKTPPGVKVRQVDVSGELEILDYQLRYDNRKTINDTR